MTPDAPAVSVSTQRVLSAAADDIQAQLAAWMPRMEALVADPTSADGHGARTLRWAPRRDPRGNRLRSLGFGGRRLEFLRTDSVTAELTAVDAQHTVLRLTAALHSTARRGDRRQWTLTAMLVVLAGLLVVYVARAARDGAAMGLAIISALTCLAVAWAVLRWALSREVRVGQARTQAHMTLLLDALERGALTPPAWPRRRRTPA